MADTQHNEQATFTASDVASLVRYVEEEGDKVFALLSAIHSMAPVNHAGDFEDPSSVTLVRMAMDIVGDVSFLKHYKDKLMAAKAPA